ncbi:MAG: 2-octaprenylphenol hydroxylase [Sodalis sp. Psp]|nr:2-octaprenylphenol hydroxylase [Sodalis sp. Psp]MCR3757375.1 2-octaprenylphenol hydroxylase [Sodalis sp. Ppy]
MQAFDVVINGGGMVGLALACGLKGSGLRVAVVERQAPILPVDRSARRISAINAASRRLLQHVQVWESIITQRANPYRGIEVWEQDSFGKVFFDSTELGHPHLGHIIENSVIQQTLWRHASQVDDITLFSPATLRQVIWEENEVFVTLDNDRTMTARLMVAADGAHSWLRQHADIPLTFWDYQHHALVATIRTELPHGNIARQVFHGDGILAFLPLIDPHLSSIVWSLSPEVAQQRLIQPVDTFNVALAICFSLALGLCELQDERQTFPLTGRYARNFAAHRLVLVGDAAHTVHPLAGQGVNLGFMDVAVLLGELQRLQKSGKDTGYYPYLRRYERNRKHSAALILAKMQGFRELFSGHHPVKKWIRTTGLWLTDTLPNVKLRFVQQILGLNDLPAWLATNHFD